MSLFRTVLNKVEKNPCFHSLYHLLDHEIKIINKLQKIGFNENIWTRKPTKFESFAETDKVTKYHKGRKMRLTSKSFVDNER